MKRSLCMFLLLAMVLSLCSCGDGSNGGENSKESDQQPSSAGTDSTEADPNSVGLDGTIVGDFFSISITDVKWTTSLETPFATITPENEGSKLLCIFFEAENTTEETRNLGMFSAYVNSHVATQTAIGGEIDGAMPFVGAVASGMSMKAYAVWELSEDWEEFQINYFESTGPECKQHFVIHREDIE